VSCLPALSKKATTKEEREMHRNRVFELLEDTATAIGAAVMLGAFVRFCIRIEKRNEAEREEDETCPYVMDGEHADESWGDENEWNGGQKKFGESGFGSSGLFRSRKDPEEGDETAGSKNNYINF
jgi:hypothetical protein